MWVYAHTLYNRYFQDLHSKTPYVKCFPMAMLKAKKIDDTPSLSTSCMRKQATPQNATPKGVDGPITYHPVKADAVKAFFGGTVKRANTSPSQPDLMACESQLPPTGVILPPAPVPQILPVEIQNENTDFNRREDALMTQLYKLDDVELQTRLQRAINHPLFKTYSTDMIQPECDDCPDLLDFGSSPIEDICSFELWLQSQGADITQQKAAWGDASQKPIAPPTAPVAHENTMQDTELDSTQVSEVATTPETRQPAQAAQASAPAATPPLAKLLPDNQLGDSSIFSPPTPAPSSLKSAPVPSSSPRSADPSALEFQPITAESMKAFWCSLRRKSTDELSAANRVEPPKTPPAPPASFPTQPPVPTSSPVVPSPTPSPTPVPTATPASAPSMASSPGPSETPVHSPAAVPPAAPTPPAVETADPKEARAAYMRFYRSVRSTKAPAAVTKTLGVNSTCPY